jgi:hypothetical protein
MNVRFKCMSKRRGPENGMTSAQHVRKVDHLACRDQLDGVEHDLRSHEIAGAALVADAPFRRAASAFGRHCPGRGLREGSGARHEHCVHRGCECDAFHGFFLPDISRIRMSFGPLIMRPQHNAFKIVN